MSEENSAPMPTPAAAGAETPESVSVPLADAAEPVSAAAVDAPPPPVAPVALPLNVGDRLRTAREAKGLSLAEIAQSLKLSVRQIEALEAGDWSRLPGATFVRGFLRNYARQLQIDAAPLLAALDAEKPVPPPQPLALPQGAGATLPQGGRAERRDLLAVFAGLALVVLALAAYFLVPEDFWASRHNEAATVETPAEAPVPVAESESGAAASASEAAAPVSEPAAKAAGNAADRSAPASVASPPAAPSTPAAQSQSPATPLAAAPASRTPSAAAAPAPAADAPLTFGFAQPAWVEVRDRSGQIVFSQLSPAGAERRVDGRPPFTLIVGNASNVSVRYKGKPVDLSQRSKDDVARLTLE